MANKETNSDVSSGPNSGTPYSYARTWDCAEYAKFDPEILTRTAQAAVAEAFSPEFAGRGMNMLPTFGETRKITVRVTVE